MKSLHKIYEDSEIQNILNLLVEKRIGEQFFKETIFIEPAIELQLEKDLKALCNNKPIQYLLQEAWFYKYPFYVNEHVLIPRPETEELVEKVIKYIKKNNIQTVLDIGTGSGCIAISISTALPNAIVYGLDISTDALEVASKNNRDLEANVTFLEMDILNCSFEDLPKVDLIVSNPPYIAVSEKNEMHNNVLQYEPHLALFVTDDNPLLFYKKIGALAKSMNAAAWFEISANQAENTKSALLDYFNEVTVINDMQGMPRIIFAL